MRCCNFILVLLLFLSCSNEEEQKTTAARSVGIESISFDKEKAFKIAGLEKSTSLEVLPEGISNCSSWMLSEGETAKILKASEQISKQEWHYLFDHLPCSMSGTLTQGANSFDVLVNAGSWITVSNKDTTLYFGYFSNESEKLFLSPMYTTDKANE